VTEGDLHLIEMSCEFGTVLHLMTTYPIGENICFLFLGNRIHHWRGKKDSYALLIHFFSFFFHKKPMTQHHTYIFKEESLENLLMEGLQNEASSMGQKISPSFATHVTINPEGIVSLQTTKEEKHENNIIYSKFVHNNFFWFESQKTVLPMLRDCRLRKPNKLRKNVTSKYIFCNVNSNDKALIASTRKRNKKRDWDCFVTTYTFR
jgi:hypothetical protein